MFKLSRFFTACNIRNVAWFNLDDSYLSVWNKLSGSSLHLSSVSNDVFAVVWIQL